MAIIWMLLIGACSIFCYTLVKIVYPMVKLEYKRYKLAKKLPGPPLNNCILGNIREFIVPFEEYPKSVEKLLNCYGPACRVWIPFYPIVYIGGADNAKWFFNSPDVDHKADIYHATEPLFGQGLITSNGELWQQRRKLISPAFHFKILTIFCDIFADNSIRLIQKLRAYPPDTPVDTLKIMKLFALDIVCETSMGVKINALDNPTHDFITTLARAASSVIQRLTNPWYWNDFIFYSVFPFGRETGKDVRTIRNFIEKVVKGKQRERAQKRSEAVQVVDHASLPEKKPSVFLDLLMDTAEDQAVTLSNTDLMDEVNNIFTAGYETTGTALCYIIYQLGLRPDIQERCYRELDGISDGSDREPSTTDPQEGEYLSMVIKEGLRLFPPVPIIGRKVLRDTQLGEYLIPEGTTIGLDISYLHRDPKNFPDPEKFDPDRFSLENSADRHGYAYIPFAAGRRNCIGQKFAMMALKTALAYIIRNFILESINGQEKIQSMYAVSLHPLRKLETKFHPRNCISTKYKVNGVEGAETDPTETLTKL